MANPVLSKEKIMSQTTPAGYPTMPGYQVGSQNATGSQYGFSRPEAGATYPPVGQTQGGAAPSEQAPYGAGYDHSAVQVARMTLDDVLIKTVLSFGVLLLTGALAWEGTRANPALGGGLMLVGFLGAFVVAMINSFKRTVSPALVLTYAGLEGLGLGAISSFFEASAPGVVSRAVLATVVTFAVMLALYKTKIVRYSSKMAKFVLIGMVSIVAFYLINMVVSLVAGPAYSPANITIMGFPLWVVVSLVAIVLAALSLISDFNMVEMAIQNGAERKFAWYCAFGLMVTLVWLYLEFLRLFAYFSDN